MQPLTTISPNQCTFRARQDKKQENQQTAEKPAKSIVHNLVEENG